MIRIFILLPILFSFFLPTFSSAEYSSANIGFVEDTVWYSKTDPIKDENIRVYTFVFNREQEEISGTVEFYNKGVAIGKAPFSLNSGEAKVVSVPWVVPAGKHSIFVKIIDAKKTGEEGEITPEDSGEGGGSVGDVIVIADDSEDKKKSFFLQTTDDEYIETKFIDIFNRIFGKEVYIDTETKTTVSKSDSENEDDVLVEGESSATLEADSRSITVVLDDYRATEAGKLKEKKASLKIELDNVRSEQKARNTSEKSDEESVSKEGEDEEVGIATKIGKTIDKARSSKDSDNEKETKEEVKGDSTKTEYQKELSFRNAMITAKYLWTSFLSIVFGSKIVFYVLIVVVTVLLLRLIWKMIRGRNKQSDYDYEYED
ncbi:MAG: hypothetical protein ACI9AR_000311 [Flavobacteriaceae bacterium]|jgi:hypothetical protein